MISTNHQLFSADPPVSFLKNLKVRALEPEQYQRAGELLDREHYLGDVPQIKNPSLYPSFSAAGSPAVIGVRFAALAMFAQRRHTALHEGDEAQKEHWTTRRARPSEGSPSRRQSVFRPESVWSPSLTDSGRNTDCPVMAFSVSSASLWFIPCGDSQRGGSTTEAQRARRSEMGDGRSGIDCRS